MRHSAVAILTAICVLLTSPAPANEGATKGRIQCVPSAPGGKPFLAYVEDGLALLLDVPLAMLSPICYPIVSPIIDRLNPPEARAKHRPRSRR